MELIVLFGILSVLLIAGAFYAKDPVFWNGAAKRVTRIVRAEVGSRKDRKKAKVLEKVPDEDALDWWEDEFKAIGAKPEVRVSKKKYDSTPKDAIPSAVPKPKHVLVRTDYYKSSFGPWPQWKCRCGVTGHIPVTSSLEKAQKAARAEAEEHCKTMNIVEQRLHESNGKFSF